MLTLLLQDHKGGLHFSTDAWTSPNHRAFVAFAVHFEQNGVPISLLLDFVEVAEVGNAPHANSVAE